MNPLQVLLVGQSNRPEFCAVKPFLLHWALCEEVEDLPKGNSLIQAKGFLPDLIVLLQAYPGQFSADQLEILRKLVPITPVVVVLGPWSEGEGRSGRPLPGTWRIYWHQWPARWGQQIRRWHEGKCPLWSLPPTSVEEDRILATFSAPPAGGAGTIGLFSLQPQRADWLWAGLNRLGFQVVWLVPSDGQKPGQGALTPSASPAQNPSLGGIHLPKNQHASSFPWPPQKAQFIQENRGVFPPAAEEPTPERSDTHLAEVKTLVFDATDAEGEEESWLAQLVGWMPRLNIVLLVDFPRPELWERVQRWGVKVILGKPVLLGDLVWHLNQLENE